MVGTSQCNASAMKSFYRSAQKRALLARKMCGKSQRCVTKVPGFLSPQSHRDTEKAQGNLRHLCGSVKAVASEG